MEKMRRIVSICLLINEEKLHNLLTIINASAKIWQNPLRRARPSWKFIGLSKIENCVSLDVSFAVDESLSFDWICKVSRTVSFRFLNLPTIPCPSSLASTSVAALVMPSNM